MNWTNRPTLTAAGAQIALEAAEAAAREIKTPLCFAVVDPAGHLLAFRRMDGAPTISISVSQRKAETAAALGKPTKDLQDAVNAGATMLLGVGEVCPVQGGVPIIVDGMVIGAIGGSGGSAEDDERAALAGAQAIAGKAS